MSNSTLFSPIKIGNCQLNHRVIQAPFSRLRADENSVPTILQVEYYFQRATNGGLLIAEGTCISHTNASYLRVPGIYSKEQIDGWKKVTDAVHARGGFIFLQLSYLGYIPSSTNTHEQSVASLDIMAHKINNKKPEAFTIYEIENIIQNYRQAALNAMKAGFDGVEIDSSDGCLLDQFINSFNNGRADTYGGSIQNRCRFSWAVIDAVVKAVGAKFTAIRLSSWSGLQDIKDDTPYETWGYLTSSLQECYSELAYVHFLEPDVDINNDYYKHPETDSLDYFRKLWKGPFISAGGYSFKTKEAFAVSERTGNLIAFGRLFIANPDLVERLRYIWPLNKYHRDTFFTGGVEGYVDYPFYSLLNRHITYLK